VEGTDDSELVECELIRRSRGKAPKEDQAAPPCDVEDILLFEYLFFVSDIRIVMVFVMLRGDRGSFRHDNFTQMSGKKVLMYFIYLTKFLSQFNLIYSCFVSYVLREFSARDRHVCDCLQWPTVFIKTVCTASLRFCP